MTKRKLYRFQPIAVPDNDRLNQLRKGEVWFSDPAKFNDPFDLRPVVKNLVPDRWCQEPTFAGSMRRALGNLLENAPMYQGAHLIDQALINEFQAWAGDHAEDELDWDTRLRRAIESRIAQFGVVCLTPQWDNRLMWAHYANEGKGFCIEYEVDWLQQTQDVRYVPVHYMSETPELCVSEAMFAPHPLRLLLCLKVLFKRVVQMLLESRRINVYVPNEHVTDEPFPSYRTSQKAVFSQRGLILFGY